ncbi:MAG: DegV family protein [Oscillospiraceae bacterium]|nr:DegV family protein [Oscillospiraceae bacterium]
MKPKKTGVIAECLCDLPKDMLRQYNVDIVYFLIETDTGIFTDTDEISVENVLSYMDEGHEKIVSYAPSADVYKSIFEEKLKVYDEIIFVGVSSHMSHSCENARIAAALMGDTGGRVHVFDTEHLSTGLGFFVLKAAEMAEYGFTAAEIIPELESMRSRVSTTFIAPSADYLHRNGYVSAFVQKLCRALSIHPVLKMKNGRLGVKSVVLGNYEAASRYYIRSVLKKADSIDRKAAFITHVGCGVKKVRSIQAESEKYCRFDKLHTTTASATISANCGKGTFGIMFVRNS